MDHSFSDYIGKRLKASVYASFICGITIAVVGLALSLADVHPQIKSTSANFEILWFDFSDSIYMGVLAMVLSFVIVPVVSSFTKKPENVEEIFACYNKTNEIAKAPFVEKVSVNDEKINTGISTEELPHVLENEEHETKDSLNETIE